MTIIGGTRAIALHDANTYPNVVDRLQVQLNLAIEAKRTMHTGNSVCTLPIQPDASCALNLDTKHHDNKLPAVNNKVQCCIKPSPVKIPQHCPVNSSNSSKLVITKLARHVPLLSNNRLKRKLAMLARME